MSCPRRPSAPPPLPALPPPLCYDFTPSVRPPRSLSRAPGSAGSRAALCARARAKASVPRPTPRRNTHQKRTDRPHPKSQKHINT